MPSESVFYAYIKHIDSDFTYIGVFASRDVAFQWWRAIHESASPQIRGSISRIHSQFYTQKTLSDVANTLTDPQGCPSLRDKIFFTLMNGVGSAGLTVVPTDTRRDLVSGQTYFIRSTTDHSEYWYSGNGIGTSKTARTLFRISRTAPDSDGTIMVKSDEVKVTVALRDGGTLGFVSYDTREGPVIIVGGTHPVPFTLDLILEARLSSEGSGSNSELILRGVWQGQAWELV